MKKLLFDFFPVILFFIAFKLEDDPKRGIMVATAVVIAATLVQVGYMRLRHGRIEKLDSPVISVVRLSKPIDYDAPDGQPVWLAVGLLVPVEANDTHLKLFSLLVTRFRDRHFVESMKRCSTREQAAALFDVLEPDG